MADRPYLSIGEVLGLLKDEFPDITISKIRFLESQGLLDPERTPSGYRKFYDGDVDRLRWILRQQREHYLPLKVIKGKLGSDGADGSDDPDPGEGAAPAAAGEREPARRLEPDTSLLVDPSPAPLQVRLPDPPALDLESLKSSGGGSTYTLEELIEATGLGADDVRDLERFGILVGRKAPGGLFYDDDAVEVGKLAAGFLQFGVEARHLRTYKTAAEREAGFFEQLVTPMLKQRNPKARRQAVDTLTELSRLGQGLRVAMLRQVLKDYLSP